MKERERKKTIRNKMLVFDLVMCFIIIMGALVVFRPWIDEPLFDKVSSLVSYLLVTILVYVAMRIFIKVNLIPDLERQMESKEMVENNFKIGIMQEVIPIDADGYKDFVLTTLTEMAKFYAVIDGCDSKYIKVYIVYNNECNKYYQFDEIKREFFIDYYKIV